MPYVVARPDAWAKPAEQSRAGESQREREQGESMIKAQYQYSSIPSTTVMPTEGRRGERDTECKPTANETHDVWRYTSPATVNSRFVLLSGRPNDICMEMSPSIRSGLPQAFLLSGGPMGAHEPHEARAARQRKRILFMQA